MQTGASAKLVQVPNRRQPDGGTRRRRAKSGNSQGTAAGHAAPPAGVPGLAGRSSGIRPRSGRDRPVHGPTSSCSRGRKLPPLSRIMLARGRRFVSRHLTKMTAGFNPGRLTMFLGFLMSASPKPPAPSVLTKHRPRAPEAGLWPAAEQSPDVPANPALASRRNYFRPKRAA